MQRRWFWVLIAVGAVLEAAAAASIAIAAFSEPFPRGWTSYAPISQAETPGRLTSLRWATDKGFLVAGVVLAASGIVAFAASVRGR